MDSILKDICSCYEIDRSRIEEIILGCKMNIIEKKVIKIICERNNINYDVVIENDLIDLYESKLLTDKSIERLRKENADLKQKLTDIQIELVAIRKEHSKMAILLAETISSIHPK
jgi:hypothetical protein